MDLLEKIKGGEKFDELDVVLYCQDGMKSGSLRGYLDHALLHLSDPTYEGQHTNRFVEDSWDDVGRADFILLLAKDEEAETIVETGQV